MKARVLKIGCLAIASILFIILAFSFSHVSITPLMNNRGRTYEKAEVVKVNAPTRGYIRARVIAGKHLGQTLTARSVDSYLYGAKCQVGMKVILIVTASSTNIEASVYSENRAPALYGMIALFIGIVILIGGKKGFISIVALVYTLLCIIFIFLPMIYVGVSPILASILIVAMTTFVTMILIDGVSAKSLSAIVGTILGVIMAALYALLFSLVTHIGGYNVSDIENLIYVGEMTHIQIGELLFAGILIAALGAVMDVGMSIASFLDELKHKSPSISQKELFKSGMHVGKDMMGTMTNTLILAFVGGSINTLVFMYAYHYPYLQLINMYSLGIEIMQGLSSSLGVILAVPATSFVTSVLLTFKKQGLPDLQNNASNK